MANVYLNTGALSLYSSADGSTWTVISGNSPYILAVNTYYKLTAVPPSGQILSKWTLTNNIDNIINLSSEYTPEVTFNTNNQVWDYSENQTITIAATYVNEDNEFLNKRGLEDVVGRVAKIQGVLDFPSIENAKENTMYIKCKKEEIEALNNNLLDLSELAKVFDNIDDPSSFNNIKDIQALYSAISQSFKEGTVTGNVAAATLEETYGIEIPEIHVYDVE